MTPLNHKVSEPQLVWHLGSTTSACPVLIPPRHTHPPLEDKQWGWMDLALQKSNYSGSKCFSCRKTRRTSLSSPALRFRHQIEGPAPFSTQGPGAVPSFCHVPVVLHGSSQQRREILGAGWSQGVGRELLTARAGTWPPVTHPPPSSSSARCSPSPCPTSSHASQRWARWTGPASAKRLPTAAVGRTGSARAGGRRRNMGSSSQGDRGRNVKIQAEGLVANAAP